ncbi:MAG: hypothetical protein ACKOF9_03020 [Burkholderiales bacterium]
MKPDDIRVARINRRHFQGLLVATACGAGAVTHAVNDLPLFDAHIHYSHDAWDLVPPKQAVELLRQAGLRGAFVSSSNDQGTQMLLAEAPDLIVHALRPYRTRGELSTWTRDDSVLRYVEERLAKFRYVGVGEFHLFGDEADLPVPRRLVALAREHSLVLHAHSDVAAVDKLFKQWPDSNVVWHFAHRVRPVKPRMRPQHQGIRPMLE